MSDNAELSSAGLVEEAVAQDRAGCLTDAALSARKAIDTALPGARALPWLTLARVSRHSARLDRIVLAVRAAQEGVRLAREEDWSADRMAVAELELAAAHVVHRDHDSLQRLVTPHLHDPPMGLVAGRAWFLIGTMRDQDAEYPAALRAYQRAVAAYGTECGLSEDIAVARGAIAGVLDRLGQSRIAEAMYAEAGAYWQTQRIEASWSRGGAIWLLNQAIVTRHLGRYIQAKEDLVQAADAFAGMQEMEHARAAALADLANALAALGQRDEALAAANKAVALLDGRPGQEARLADVRAVLGNCWADRGNLSAATAEYAKAAESERASQPDKARFDVLRALARAQDVPEKWRGYAAAIEKMESDPIGLQHDEALARVNYGLLIEWAGDFRRAERNYRLALERFAALEGTERSAARCRVNLAYALAHQGRLEEALGEAVRAANFLDADRFTIKSHAQREAWSSVVVNPALRLSLRLAAACRRDDLVAGIVIRSRAQGVRLSSVHYADEDWQDEDLPLGPLPPLVHPSDQRPVTGTTDTAGQPGPACCFR